MHYVLCSVVIVVIVNLPHDCPVSLGKRQWCFVGGVHKSELVR